MKKSFFTWGKKSVKKLPESKDGKSTMQKINESLVTHGVA